MGLVDVLRGSRICIDTAPFVYFIEKHRKYLNLLSPVFAEIDAGQIDATTSTITLLEVLVHPFRMKNEVLAEKYRKILMYSRNLTVYEILNEVAEMAARLRANYTIKTPDAIQMAVGMIYGATFFLTNDPKLKKVHDIKVTVLDDFIKR